MKLQDQLDAYKKGFLKQAPESVVALIQRSTKKLAESGILERAMKVGDRSPDFTLKNSTGDSVGLAGLRDSGPVVLSFYRGKW